MTLTYNSMQPGGGAQAGGRGRGRRGVCVVSVEKCEEIGEIGEMWRRAEKRVVAADAIIYLNAMARNCGDFQADADALQKHAYTFFARARVKKGGGFPRTEST